MKGERELLERRKRKVRRTREKKEKMFGGFYAIFFFICFTSRPRKERESKQRAGMATVAKNKQTPAR